MLLLDDSAMLNASFCSFFNKTFGGVVLKLISPVCKGMMSGDLGILHVAVLVNQFTNMSSKWVLLYMVLNLLVPYCKLT